MKKYLRPALALIIGALLVISGCNLPVGLQQETAVESAVPVVVVTATVEACDPTVTANTVANVRSGPDTIYNIVGSIPQGGSAKIVGRNDFSTWWYIVFPGGPGGYAWIAGSVTTANCVPPLLQVVAAPPPPVAQQPPQQQPQQQEEEQPEEEDSGDSGGSPPVGPAYEIDPDFLFPLFLWTPTPTPFPFDFDFELPDFGWP